MSLTRSRVFQYIGILLAFGLIAVGYWYFQVRAGGKLNAPQTGQITSGLVGYWTFDGADTSSTTATDKSGSGNSGTLNNSPQKVPGKVGQALNFFPNGTDSNSRVNMGDPAGGQLDFGSGDFSIGFWMRNRGFSDQTSSVNVALAKRNIDSGVGAGYSFQYANTNLMLFAVGNGTSAGTVTAPKSMADNEWHYYVGLRSGSTMYLYMDGDNMGSATLSGSVSNSDKFTIGSDDVGASGNTRNSNADIDEVRVYNRALSIGEIQSLFALGQSDKINTVVSQGNNTLALGLSSYWRLDENTGTSTSDSSVNAATATLNNGTAWTTGRIGSAASFDGTDDTITGTGAALSNTGSIAAWVRPLFSNGAGTVVRTFALTSGSGTFVSLDYNSFTDHYSFNLGYRGSFGTQREVQGANHGSGDTWLQQWHYVVGTWDINRGGNLYVDGILEKSFSGTSGSVTNGTSYTIGSSSWNGYVDELRYYNRELSPDEILQLYRLTVPTGVDTSLRGYWTFNGGDISGTTAYDRSGYQNNGTLTNGPVAISGSVGQALSFDGSNDYVTTADVAAFSPSVNDISVSAWAKIPTTASATGEGSCGSTGRFILGKGTGSNYEFNIEIDNNNLVCFDLWQSGGTAYGVASLNRTMNDGQWHLYTMTVDYGVLLTGYIDAVPVVTNSSFTGSMSNGTAAFIIGQKGDNSNYFSGNIDEVRIYNRALVTREVQALYDQGAPDKINSAVSTPQGTGQLDSGLAGYWKLDDGSGTSATDSSTNGNTGTLTNGPTWGTGQIGGDVVFDGSNDYISVPDSTALQPGSNSWSVCTWANPPNSNQTTTLVGKRQSISPLAGYSLSICAADATCGGGAGKRLIFTYAENLVGPTYRGAYSSADVTTGNWRYFCAVADKGANTVRLYVDGTEIPASVAGTGGSWPSITNTDVLTLGSSAGNNYYTGSLDEPRIYNRVLTSDEISRLYRMTAPSGTDTSLKGYWSFNGQDVSGTTAYDRSGAGNNGTLTNGPTVTPGRLGQALNFDGSNDNVLIGNVTVPTSAMTVTAWVQPASFAAGGYRIVSKWGSASNSDTFLLTQDDPGNGKFRFAVRLTDTFELCDTTSAATIGTWVFVAGSWDGSNCHTYFNGTEETNKSEGGSGSLRLGSVNLRIGIEGNDGTSSPYSGKIDEVRIYNRALSAAEMAALYNQGR